MCDAIALTTLHIPFSSIIFIRLISVNFVWRVVFDIHDKDPCSIFKSTGSLQSFIIIEKGPEKTKTKTIDYVNQGNTFTVSML